MSASDKPDREPRIWAKQARAKKLPQRAFSRAMRLTPTEAEQKLWWHLRRRLTISGSHFRRQVRIGPYIADFVCHAKHVVVEVDGSQHGPLSTADDERTKVLEAHGYRVLRYWNNDVLTNVDGVLEDILTKLRDPHP